MAGRVAIREDRVFVLVAYILAYLNSHVRIANVEELEVVRCLGTSCVSSNLHHYALVNTSTCTHHSVDPKRLVKDLGGRTYVA